MSTSAVSIADVDVVTWVDEVEGELDDGSEGNGEGEREGKVVAAKAQKSVSAAINCNAGGRRRCGGINGRDVRGWNCLHYTDDALTRVTVVVELYIGY